MAGSSVDAVRPSRREIGVNGVDLRIDRINKRFGTTTALDDISLKVDGGTFLTLLGASGSGKSTTLMTIAGFLEPDSGTIMVNGKNVVGQPAHQRDFGVVFQNYALFPHMRVFDNVAFPLKMRNRPRREIHAQVDETLDLVKLNDLGERMPHQLSGGQQQRVALARAIISRPRLLLMDEPLSALDKQLREHVQLELKDIQRRLGVTVVYVTHDQSEALVMSDRIAIMRAGRIEQFGSPADIYDRPATRYTAEFIGDSNFLEGVVRQATTGTCTIALGSLMIEARCATTVRPDDIVQFVIRPERLRVGADPASQNRVEGVAQDVIFVGDALRIRVLTAAGIALNCKMQRHDAGAAITPGDRVTLCWSADATVVVDVRP